MTTCLVILVKCFQPYISYILFFAELESLFLFFLLFACGHLSFQILSAATPFPAHLSHLPTFESRPQIPLSRLHFELPSTNSEISIALKVNKSEIAISKFSISYLPIDIYELWTTYQKIPGLQFQSASTNFD